MFGLRRVLVVCLFLPLVTFAAAAQNSGASSEYFKVSPVITAPGQFVHFSWHVSGAGNLAVTPSLLAEPDEGSLPSKAENYVQVAPAVSTVYRASGSKLMTASLTVVPVSIAASGSNVEAGQSVSLTFTGPNNGSTFFLTTLPENSATPLFPDSCNGSTCSGSYLTAPLSSNKTFMVWANGPYQGQSYSQAVNVSVRGGTTLSCVANPTVIKAGEAVTLSWTTVNATGLRIDQGVGEVAPLVSGRVTVHPTESTRYTCTATDRFGNQLSSPVRVTVSTGDVTNLNHIVYMLQENRSFDDYFGNLAYYRVNVDHIPGAQLSDVNDLHDLPSGFMLYNQQGQGFPPFHSRTECTDGLGEDWNQSHNDMDLVGDNWLHLTQNSQYLMDKFLVNTSQSQYDPTYTRSLGYYDWTDLPFYYELAAQFDASDTWYSPVPDTTVINRSYLFAATSYGDIFDPAQNNWLWTRPTLFRVLQNAGISWRYYYQDNSVFLASWNDWNNPQIQSNVRNIQEWYNILASQNADQDLPQVVFIERASATGYDEHPGNNIQKGAARVQQIMNALLTSTAWPDSVFILTYDEGGGLFDQQGPILVTEPDDKVPGPNQAGAYIRGYFNVTGFRVPNIIVSPWAKPHTVFHLQTDYTSILKLIETRYNLPPLTFRDRNIGDLTDPTNGPFDFSSPQMLQVPPLPTQPTNGTCNYSLESYPD